MKKQLVIAACLLCVSLPAFAVTISDVQKEYLSGNLEDALTQAKKLPENDEALYYLGLIYMKIGNLPESRSYFLKIMENMKTSPYYEQALTKFADTSYLENDFTQAKKLYTELEKKGPSFDYLPVVYLRLAQIANKEGDWQSRDSYLNILRTRYPDSAEMTIARTLKDYSDFFTVQVGAFGEKKNATELVQELKGKFEAYVLTEKKNNLTLYKVRVGKFKDRKGAQEASYQLIKLGFPARIFP
jgi:tetratricopeptide (TPR) repeat protein